MTSLYPPSPSGARVLPMPTPVLLITKLSYFYFLETVAGIASFLGSVVLKIIFRLQKGHPLHLWKACTGGCPDHLSISRAWVREAAWTLVAVGPVEAFAALWYLRDKMCVAL